MAFCSAIPPLIQEEEMVVSETKVMTDSCLINPQLHHLVPCLLLPRRAEDQATGSLKFYCLICGKDDDVPLQRLADRPRWKYCLNSCGDWLMVFDEISDPHMINPFTGAHLTLPPFSSFDEVKPLYGGPDQEIPNGPIVRYHFEYLYYAPVHTLQGAGRVYFKKAIIGFSSPTSYTVMAIHMGHRRDLAFARAGDKAWTSMDLGESFQDIMFLDGRFYSLNCEGRLTAYDFSGSRPMPKSTVASGPLAPSKKEKIRYLACSPDGSQIFQIGKDEASSQDCHVFKLCSDDRWQLTLDLEGLSFFLGDNQAISVKTCDVPGAAKDCVYFTDVFKHFQVEHRSQIPNSDDFKLGFGNFRSLYRKKYLSAWPRPVWYMRSKLPEVGKPSDAEEEKGVEVEKPSDAEEEKVKEERQLEVASIGRNGEAMRTEEEGTPAKKRARCTGQ